MTEDQLEREALGWLAEVGYSTLYGPDIAAEPRGQTKPLSAHPTHRYHSSCFAKQVAGDLYKKSHFLTMSQSSFLMEMRAGYWKECVRCR